MPDFHMERLFSLQLAEDQKRPENGVYNKKSMFVISKIDILKKKASPYQIDPLEKQAYIEFDKIPSTAESSAEQLSIDLYRLHLDADPAYNIVATESEIKYCRENIASIRKLREKAIKKDIDLCRSEASFMQDISASQAKSFANPVPNHLHCGVCRVAYEDYNQHIATNEHKSQIGVHKNMYDYIDRELEDIAAISKKRGWKTSPVREEKPQTPTLPLKPITIHQVNSASK